MQCPPKDSLDEERGAAEQIFRDGLHEFTDNAPRVEDRPLDAELRNVIEDLFGQVDATMQGNEFAPMDKDEEPPRAHNANA